MGTRRAKVASRSALARFGQIGLLVALGLLPSPAARAAATEESFLEKPRAAFASKLELVQQRYAGSLSEISNDFRTVLSRYAVAARADGRVREYQAAKQALDRFQAAGQIEKPDVSAESDYVGKTQRAVLAAQAAALRTMRIDEAKLRQAYVQFLEKSKGALTQQNRLVEVDEVEAEIEMVRAFLDPDLLAPPQPAAEPPRRAPAGPAAAPGALRPRVEKPIPKDRLVVYAADENGPVPGLGIALRSHTFGKTFRKATDKEGRAEFEIIPELEYGIYVLDAKVEPFVQPHCVGGEAYDVALKAMPAGVQILEVPLTGEIKLPGLSGIRISGYSGRAGVITALSLQPSSFRTTFVDHPPAENGIQLPPDIWTTVVERSTRLEMKIMLLQDNVRIVLYRTLANAGETGAPDAPGVAPSGPRQARPAAPDESQLTVLAKDPKVPVAGLDVTLVSLVDGKSLSKRTDRTGKALFAVDPTAEYTLKTTSRHYEPHVKQHCIGGEAYSIELVPLPKDVEVIQLAGSGELQLPGISVIQVFGYAGSPGDISAVFLKPTSPKTTFAGYEPGQDRITLNVDTWMAVSERSKRLEIKVLAPDAHTRIFFCRKLP